MSQTVGRIDFAHLEVAPSQWPKSSCSAASQLAIQDGDLHLETDRALLFPDNGQIRALSDESRRGGNGIPSASF